MITVISLYDPVAGICKVLRFVDLNYDCEVVYTDNYLDTVAELVKYLDDADSLCGFNSTSFDIPFIQIQFKIDNDRVQKWVCKNYDILEICRRGFARTFNLNSCLALNGFNTGKIGSGMEAVHQAQRGDFKELELYCAEDARLTYELSNLPIIYCCENYKWRKAHGERTHDPKRVLMIHTDKLPALSFSYGPLPGYAMDIEIEEGLLKRKSLEMEVKSASVAKVKCEKIVE